MTACETTLLVVIVCAIASNIFFHLQSRRARLVGFAEGYGTCAEEWRAAVDLKQELDEVNNDG